MEKVSKMSYYPESASWCLGCAQRMLLIIIAILLAGRRNVAQTPLGGMPFSGNLKIRLRGKLVQRGPSSVAREGCSKQGATVVVLWILGEPSVWPGRWGSGLQGAHARAWVPQCKRRVVPQRSPTESSRTAGLSVHGIFHHAPGRHVYRLRYFSFETAKPYRRVRHVFLVKHPSLSRNRFSRFF